MPFEWDEDKQRSNLAKHGVDFFDMRSLFDGRPLLTKDSLYPGEDRFLSTGEVDGRTYTVVWTWRADTIRFMSARRARGGEDRAYRALPRR